MIVNRRTWGIKSDCLQDAVILLKNECEAESERGGYSSALRIYASEAGEIHRVSAEWEYESEAECHRYRSQWGARPTTAVFLERWHALRTGAEADEM